MEEKKMTRMFHRSSSIPKPGMRQSGHGPRLAFCMTRPLRTYTMAGWCGRNARARVERNERLKVNDEVRWCDVGRADPLCLEAGAALDQVLGEWVLLDRIGEMRFQALVGRKPNFGNN